MSYSSQILKCEKIENLVSIFTNLLNNFIDSQRTEEPFSRIEVEIPPIDSLEWLYNQKSDKKIYWSNRDGNLEISAVGTTDIIYDKNREQQKNKLTNLIENLKKSDKRIRYFGGFKFDSNQPISDDWKLFGNFLFILPKFELIRRDTHYYFACNINNIHLKNNNELIENLNGLSFYLPEKTKFRNKLISRSDNPDKSGWSKNIENAKDKINLGEIDKIVLSRQTELICEEDLSPEGLLKRLKSENTNSYHFLLKLNDNYTFIGVSPEKLFTRNGYKIECEAIAGTVRRGKNEMEDEQLGRFLLNNKKDITEHRFVIKSIVESLREFVELKTETQKIDVKLLKLSELQHLVSRFEYDLKTDVSDYDLFVKLHPTAAVGGYPKKQALKEISETEKFDRGWYAAPIGWIGSESTEFVVGIRSGLLNNNRLLLYSGAGIIESSDAVAEWDEIENKLSNYLKIFV